MKDMNDERISGPRCIFNLLLSMFLFWLALVILFRL